MLFCLQKFKCLYTLTCLQDPAILLFVNSHLFTRSCNFCDGSGSCPFLHDNTASVLNTLMTRSCELTRNELKRKTKFVNKKYIQGSVDKV